jgi:hypothetical protein
MGISQVFRPLLFLVSFLLPNQKLPKDALIESSSIKADDRPHNGFILPLGTGFELDRSIGNFEANINFSKNLIGLSTEAGWGIPCDQKTSIQSNSCYLISNETSMDKYGNTNIKIKAGEIHLRLTQSIKILSSDTPSCKMPISLISGGDAWPIENWGVIGLSPQGQFANYYRNLFKESFQILMLYKVSNFDIELQKPTFQLNSLLNPEYDQKLVLIENHLVKEELFWSLQGELDMSPVNGQIPRGKICLSSIVEDVIIIPNAVDHCNSLRSIVCENLPAADCKRQVIDFAKVPKFNLTISEKIIEITPDMYLYFQENVLNCRFGELADIKGKECADDSQMALGKFFFQTYVPVFRFNPDGSSDMLLLDKFERTTDEPKLWTLIYIFGIFAFGIAVFFFMVVFNEVRSRKIEEPQLYHDLLA